MKLLQHLLSWIDSYFQTESIRRQKARLHLAAAGVKEGQIDALMKTIVPLSSIYGFDVLECCKVLAQVAMIGRLLDVDNRQLMNMNFPILLILMQVYFTDQRGIIKMVGNGEIDWHRLAVGIIWYYDEL